MPLASDRTVREIALENPATVRVFESLGIDYCCGGKRTLKEACLRANVPEETVLRLLASPERGREEEDGAWSGAPFADLTAHIVNRHHEFIRRESPRLTALLEKVTTRHGKSHPELASIKEVFAGIVQELSTHMLNEEQVLFPYLKSMDAAIRQGRQAPPAFFGSVRNPIGRMLADHDDAGTMLRRVSELSGRYAAPPDACPSYRGLYQGLEEFERDLHQHIHLENNILFARALEMENSGLIESPIAR